MRIRRLISLLALPLALAACESEAPAAPETPPEIAGRWQQQQSDHPSVANMTVHMMFGPGDRFEREVRNYRDAGHGTLTSSSTAEGEFRLRGDRLELRVTKETSWDGLRNEVHVDTKRSAPWADAGTVQISGNTMIRTFLIYPADAPIETVATYVRLRRD